MFKLKWWKRKIVDPIFHPIGEKATVRITNDDLANGVPNNAALCAIAMAAKRIFKKATSITVGWDAITVGFEDRTETWRNPTRTADGERELARYIRDYDHDVPVEPRDFVIERTYVGRFL